MPAISTARRSRPNSRPLFAGPTRAGRTLEIRFPTIRGHWDAYYRNIAEHLEGRSPLAVTAEQAREVVRLLEAATRSTREHATSPDLGADHEEDEGSGNWGALWFSAGVVQSASPIALPAQQEFFIIQTSLSLRSKRRTVSLSMGQTSRFGIPARRSNRGYGKCGEAVNLKTSEGVESMTRHSLERSRR